ncbi:MAG TPA: hypothetical protein VM345_00935, partial [Acidimicrobiales bacterium]|nr:hypothetical protein [Acidimicrobiales bacterium]
LTSSPALPAIKQPATSSRPRAHQQAAKAALAWASTLLTRAALSEMPNEATNWEPLIEVGDP